MRLDDFEHDVRDIIEQILNHLQSASLLTVPLSSQAEREILMAGRLVQDLSLLVEEFVAQRRGEQDS